MHHTCASPPLSLYAAVMLHNVLGKAQMFSLLKVKILHGPDRILHSTNQFLLSSCHSPLSA